MVAQPAAWGAAARLMRVTVAADGGWLRQAGRRFPVVIDPTIVVEPTAADAQNTMIESDTPTSNYDSSWRLSVGTTGSADVRALLKFPLTTVPAGAQIDSPDLRLYYDQQYGSGSSNEAIQADQATAAWDASTATWSNASANVGGEGVNEVDVDDSATASVAASGAWPSAARSAAVHGGYRYDHDAVAAGRWAAATRLGVAA